jgi:hypothetical protein
MGDMSGDVAGVDEPPVDCPLSESTEDLREVDEEFADAIDGRSGAVKARLFVDEISSTGDEILFLRIVPEAYLTWPSRCGMGAEICGRRLRFVNDLAIEDGVDIVRPTRSN